MGLREEIKRQVNVCLDELRRDALGERSLRRIAELADGLAGGRQDLLYLQGRADLGHEQGDRHEQVRRRRVLGRPG